MKYVGGLSRAQIYDSWADYYRRMTRDRALGHCRELGGILEGRLRRLCNRKGYTNHLGMNKRALLRLVGLALGVHRQLEHQITTGKLTVSLPSSGKIGVEGGKRYMNAGEASLQY